MQQNIKLSDDTNHDVDAAISIPPGRIVHVEVNKKEPPIYDGFHLNFTNASYVVVATKKNKNSTLYSIIHGNETIIAADIRRELSWKKAHYKRFFIFNKSTSANIKRYIKSEFPDDYVITLTIDKPHGYIPFTSVDHLSQEVALYKSSSVESSAPGKKCKEKASKKIIMELGRLPKNEELEIYTHPQGMKLFVCDNLHKFFPTAKELEERSRSLVLYKNGYWVPLADDDIDIPKDALLLYNNYVSETTNVNKIYNNLYDVLDKKHDFRFVTSLLLGYKYNYDISLMIRESIQKVLDDFKKRKSSSSKGVESSLNVLQEVIISPKFINIKKLTILGSSLNKIIVFKKDNGKDEKDNQITIRDLTFINNYVVACINTHFVFNDQLVFNDQETERRKRAGLFMIQAYSRVMANKYNEAIDILKEGERFTRRLCLSSDILPVIFYMEIAEKCSTQFSILSRQNNIIKAMNLVTPALDAVVKAFSYRKAHYMQDFVMIKLNDLLQYLLVELCRYDNCYIQKIGETVSNFISEHTQQSISDCENYKEESITDSYQPMYSSRINKIVETNILIKNIIDLFHIYCQSEKLIKILQHRLDKQLTPLKKEFVVPMMQVIDKLILEFSKSLKRLKISQKFIDSSTKKTTRLLMQLEMKLYKINPANDWSSENADRKPKLTNTNGQDTFWSNPSSEKNRSTDQDAIFKRIGTNYYTLTGR